MPESPTLNDRLIHVESDDLPLFVEMLSEKFCEYQLRDGRDLYCAAAASDDESADRVSGAQRLAPTSRSLCAGCDLPSTDAICSHFMHPRVTAVVASAGIIGRRVRGALCDLGRPEIQHEAGCRPGVNACWERVQQPASVPLPVGPSPLSLPEALDFLDTMWRLAFGKRLLGPSSAAHAASLALACRDRSEFRDRMTAWADVFDSLIVPTPPGEKKRDGTFNQLHAWLEHKLSDVASIGRAADATALLRRANDLRNAEQHGDAAKKLPSAMAALGLAYPPHWPDMWDGVRARTIEALASLRDEVRTLT